MLIYYHKCIKFNLQLENQQLGKAVEPNIRAVSRPLLLASSYSRRGAWYCRGWNSRRDLYLWIHSYIYMYYYLDFIFTLASIKGLLSTHRWYVSGTPFPTEYEPFSFPCALRFPIWRLFHFRETIGGLLEFMGVESTDPEFYYGFSSDRDKRNLQALGHHVRKQLLDAILANSFWRNTKVKIEIKALFYNKSVYLYQ